MTIPAGAVAGTRYICGIADYLGQVSESSETDNTLRDPINILVPTVNLKINGADAVYPAFLTTGNPVNLTISMTPGTKLLDHYYALIWDGVVYWVTPSGSLSLTPVPLSNFAPVALTDFSLLGSNLPTGVWGFAWLMSDGSVVVDSDIIVANVTP